MVKIFKHVIIWTFQLQNNILTQRVYKYIACVYIYTYIGGGVPAFLGNVLQEPSPFAAM